jgi:redox-sensitive bicupin YhaK (pirin superfamily)
MKNRSIQQVLPPPSPHMVGDGFRVHNFFPGGYSIDNKRMSPFFMLDYNSKIEFSPRDTPRGVGVHPHRGFETVTISYHGSVAHHDSHGNSGVIGPGDVQWMTAASGVLHKEYHDEAFTKAGGLFQMVQLWVNLPAKNKMSEPKYQAVTSDMMGRHNLPGADGWVEVVAGEFKGTKGPVTTFTPIELYNIHLQGGATVSFDLPSNFNTGILVVEGSVATDTGNAPTDNFILYENDGETITLTALDDSILLVLSGEPIDEPIASYGPYLMNTHEERCRTICRAA